MVGGILLGMTALHFAVKSTKNNPSSDQDDGGSSPKGSVVMGAFFGLLGGMATMLANAAGPVAQLYLLAMGLPKYRLMDFCLALSYCQYRQDSLHGRFGNHHLGIHVGELVDVCSSCRWSLLAPFLVKCINQTLFERLVWLFIVIAGIRMLF